MRGAAKVLTSSIERGYYRSTAEAPHSARNISGEMRNEVTIVCLVHERILGLENSLLVSEPTTRLAARNACLRVVGAHDRRDFRLLLRSVAPRFPFCCGLVGRKI